MGSVFKLLDMSNRLHYDTWRLMADGDDKTVLENEKGVSQCAS